MVGVTVCMTMTFFMVYLGIMAAKTHKFHLVVFWGYNALLWGYLSIVAIYGFYTFG